MDYTNKIFANIAKDMSEQKDIAVVRAFVFQITELLQKNGIMPICTERYLNINSDKSSYSIIRKINISAVPVSACTPPLNPPSIEILDINFEPDGALKDAIDNYVKNWLEKCILDTPVVEYVSYYKSASRYFNYSHVVVKWTKVENATSYKVRITKADGTWKEYDTTYTALYSTNYTDDFIVDGMDGATVSVKAYGDNDTFWYWSDDTNIARFGSIYRKEN